MEDLFFDTREDIYNNDLEEVAEAVYDNLTDEEQSEIDEIE